MLMLVGGVSTMNLDMAECSLLGSMVRWLLLSEII